MNSFIRVLLISTLAVLLAACSQDAPAPKDAEKAPVPVPTNDDANAWKAYVVDVVGRNMQGVSNSPYLYLLPAESSADFQVKYDSLLGKATTDVSYGIPAGNLLAYASASQSSTRIADLVVEAFKDVKPDSLKGVKLLFIGQAADSERVKAAVTASGVSYSFVEAK